MSNTVLVRIRRMGEQWATTGIGLGVPPEISRDHPDYADIAARAAKLMPGQVVELPETHFLVTPQHACVEIVRDRAKDEVLRPWVFETHDDAVALNPWKSNMTPAQIEDMNIMRASAVTKAREQQDARDADREAEPESLAAVTARRGRARMT